MLHRRGALSAATRHSNHGRRASRTISLHPVRTGHSAYFQTFLDAGHPGACLRQVRAVRPDCSIPSSPLLSRHLIESPGEDDWTDVKLLASEGTPNGLEG